jgi:hypothetical protein
MPLISGAGPSSLIADQAGTPFFAGGGEGTMAGYYRAKMGQNPYKRAPQDPYAMQWMGQAGADQLSDRQALSDLYTRLQAQSQGGVTPQQQQLLGGFQNAANMAGSAAMTAGGARARSAAMGGLSQQAGIQAGQNQQALGMQQAADQISARNQMLQVATQMRAQDLQAQGLSLSDALARAQEETRVRGMGIQHELGYAGLENQAIGNDTQAIIDAYRRAMAKNKADQQQTDAIVGAGMQGAGSIIGAASGA